MLNILALVAAAALVFAGAGWYLGWYEITRTTDADGHPNINIDFNNQKFSEDLKKGEQKLHDLITHKDKDGGAQHVTPQGSSPPPMPPLPVSTPSVPAPTLPTRFSTPPTATVPPPPPPPAPGTPAPGRSTATSALPGDIVPVEFAPLPVPPPTPATPPSVPLPLPPR